MLAQQQVNEFYAERSGQQRIAAAKSTTIFANVLARDDIDAVWGCVPDHWHGVVYSRVIEAGKDLYGEKPITRWIDQGIKVRDAVRRYGCVFQTGTQQRSRPHFRHACELARNGYLGKVHTVYVGAPGGRSYPAEPPCDPPEGFDYDMWTGPAPFIPFDTKRCEWLAMYMISHYCAGFITNWGVHHLDIAGWGLPRDLRQAVRDRGDRRPARRRHDRHLDLLADAIALGKRPEDELHQHGQPQQTGLQVRRRRRLGPRQSAGHLGRAGVAAGREALEAHDTPLHASPEHADPYTAHTADFFRAIRTRQDPVSPVEEGHAASTLGNVSDIALRLGRKLTWDPAGDRFVGDDQANQMLDRALRSPWEV